jgi:hypothetical protein
MNSRELEDLLARIDRDERRALVEEEAARQIAARQRREPPPPPPVLKRSEMSPAEKSRYIREHGVARYNELDWA